MIQATIYSLMESFCALFDTIKRVFSQEHARGQSMTMMMNINIKFRKIGNKITKNELNLLRMNSKNLGRWIVPLRHADPF